MKETKSGRSHPDTDNQAAALDRDAPSGGTQITPKSRFQKTIVEQTGPQETFSQVSHVTPSRSPGVRMELPDCSSNRNGASETAVRHPPGMPALKPTFLISLVSQ